MKLLNNIQSKLIELQIVFTPKLFRQNGFTYYCYKILIVIYSIIEKQSLVFNHATNHNQTIRAYSNSNRDH